jgi:hypothetical protein
MEPTPAEIVQAALDDLLTVVAKSSADLRTFHDAAARARLAPLPPFPRTSLILAERIVEHLTKVDEELREMLVALGVVSSAPNPKE